MSLGNRLNTAIKAAEELGLSPLVNLAVYKGGLKIGLWQKLTPTGRHTSPGQSVTPLRLSSPPPSWWQALPVTELNQLNQECEQIAAGKINFFGLLPTPLDWGKPEALLHWSHYEKPTYHGQDIKFTWEPARFNWVFSLARGYMASARPLYGEYFWEQLKVFITLNPVNQGPNWSSAQEVALRLIAFCFAGQVFADCPNAQPALLYQSIADHAARIPPTVSYAWSQNNNHWVSEAVGLFTAGMVLADAPQAKGWRETGWGWFNQAIQTQIQSDGTYIQQSCNYHRLMLQLSLWIYAITKDSAWALPEISRQRLAAATRWLAHLCDPISGQVPNLGHNDGSFFLPLAPGGYQDYRPVLQAASRAFLGAPCLSSGPWDELSYWLGLLQPDQSLSEIQSSAPGYLGDAASHGFLRAATFKSRPAHADQLHVDLWWNGVNYAMDAGTFFYNADPPWDNRLSSTAYHNTLTIDGQDQMERTSRFLWLNWAQAIFLPKKIQNITAAEHNGYRKLALKHRRTMEHPASNQWIITDSILNLSHINSERSYSAQLHWLLPDSEFTLEENGLALKLPFGLVRLKIETEAEINSSCQLLDLSIFRAGELLAGSAQPSPLHGWVSPTYGLKQPALSLRAFFTCLPPVKVITFIDIIPLS